MQCTWGDIEVNSLEPALHVDLVDTDVAYFVYMSGGWEEHKLELSGLR